MKIKRVEHVGMVVRDLEKSRELWEECLGLRCCGSERVGDLQLGMYPIGESLVELLEGTNSKDKYMQLFSAEKEGLNHICFEVEDIDEALNELKARGVGLLNETPREGHQGSRIAFLDPSDTGNILIELAELPSHPQ